MYRTLLALLVLGLLNLVTACSEQSPNGEVAPDGDGETLDGDTDASESEMSDGESQATLGHLLIVTTDAIKSGAKELAAFAQAREEQGYKVRVITESDYGASAEKGKARAVAIRAWLSAHLSEFPQPRYLLLIGDAHPHYGDVPMFVVWPRVSYGADFCGGYFALDCRYMESDLPYGDPSGNWDLNANGQWGEHQLDEGPGGMSFASQWAIGRIPVYFGDTDELDRILVHAIDYAKQPESERAYRQTILLPASFYYFKGQVMASVTVPVDTDGATIGEWFVTNVLKDFPKVHPVRLYEQEGVRKSAYQSDGPLTEDNVVETWNEGAGMVFWFGHGLERGVYRTVWTADSNGNQQPGGSEISQPYLLSSQRALEMKSGKPAFVVADSCEVGSAETPQNLSYALLLSGAAIGVVGSSNVTPGDATYYDDLKAELDTQSYGATNMGMLFFRSLLEGGKASQALVDSRSQLGLNGSIETDAGRLMLNYFGDPTLGLLDKAPN